MTAQHFSAPRAVVDDFFEVLDRSIDETRLSSGCPSTGGTNGYDPVAITDVDRTRSVLPSLK